MTNLEAYKDAERRLEEIRRKHNGAESREENALLDEMDVLWYRLTAEEQDSLGRLPQ